MARNGGAELFKLFLGRRFAVQQDIADFKIVRVGGELIDRITAVEQDTLITVDIGDLRFTGRSRGKTGVERE